MPTAGSLTKGFQVNATKMLLLLTIGIAACVDSEDPALTEQQQAETIEVHGCQPGYIEIGEGRNKTCVEPWWGEGGGGGGGPVGGEREPSGGGGGGGGGDRAPASKWTCDASCNVQEDEPGATCPDRVTGRGTGPSSRQACLAAQRDANSKVPRGCHKRHCHCDCFKGREIASYDDDFITAITHE
jgi:hypothetical protein